MFNFAHAFSVKRYDNLRSHFNDNGVDIMYHGKMNNEITKIAPDTIQNITLFVENYSENNGYPQPGRGATIRKAEIFLSCDTTKLAVSLINFLSFLINISQIF